MVRPIRKSDSSTKRLGAKFKNSIVIVNFFQAEKEDLKIESESLKQKSEHLLNQLNATKKEKELLEENLEKSKSEVSGLTLQLSEATARLDFFLIPCINQNKPNVNRCRHRLNSENYKNVWEA
jgi:predicted nuclease with TOPRIM domain